MSRSRLCRRLMITPMLSIFQAI